MRLLETLEKSRKFLKNLTVYDLPVEGYAFIDKSPASSMFGFYRLLVVGFMRCYHKCMENVFPKFSLVAAGLACFEFSERNGTR